MLPPDARLGKPTPRESSRAAVAPVAGVRRVSALRACGLLGSGGGSRVRAALAAQGGLAAASLSVFEPWYRRGDEVWDSFRLEGPSLTWHFRGDPHVHVWAHVANRPDVPFNAIAIESCTLRLSGAWNIKPRSLLTTKGTITAQG